MRLIGAHAATDAGIQSNAQPWSDTQSNQGDHSCLPHAIIVPLREADGETFSGYGGCRCDATTMCKSLEQV